MTHAGFFAALALVAISAPASATTLTYTGTTTGGASFNSPNENGDLPPTTVAEGNFLFSTGAFHVNTFGSYTVEVTDDTFDTYLGLYAGVFDPSKPLANAIKYNDDGVISYLSSITSDLAVGNYTFVVTSAYENDSGPYSVRVSGPSLSAPLPEPSSWMLLIGGMGAIGGAMRRRNKAATTVRFA